VSDNAFGAKGLDACADLLKHQRALTALKACNNGKRVCG
jgi:Ran GTPase-activating protein (RanGAP) involved in mRNA processing and transport